MPPSERDIREHEANERHAVLEWIRQIGATVEQWCQQQVAFMDADRAQEHAALRER